MSSHILPAFLCYCACVVLCFLSLDVDINTLLYFPSGCVLCFVCALMRVRFVCAVLELYMWGYFSLQPQYVYHTSRSSIKLREDATAEEIVVAKQRALRDNFSQDNIPTDAPEDRAPTDKDGRVIVRKPWALASAAEPHPVRMTPHVLNGRRIRAFDWGAMSVSHSIPHQQDIYMYTAR